MIDAYLRYVWPVQRRFVRLVKRCRLCIASSREVALDRDGLCKDCREPTAASPWIPTDLKPLLRGRAALLLSGGKDSCYLMSKLVGRMELLGVFVETGFCAPQARANAEKIASLCGCDLLIVNRAAEMKRLLRAAFLRGGDAYSAIDYTEGAAVFDAGRDAGGRAVTVCGLSREQLTLHGGRSVVRDKRGLLLSPLAEWNPTDDEITGHLERLGMPPRSFDPRVTNSTLLPTMLALDMLRLGYCSFEREFANRVRRGEAERAKWLGTFELIEWAATRGWMSGEVRRGLATLGLTAGDVLSPNSSASSQ